MCLNLVDYAAKIGLTIDHMKLQRILGVSVVPAVAVRGEGVDETIHAVLMMSEEKAWTSTPVRYGQRVEACIEELQRVLQRDLKETPHSIPWRALALLLLEGDLELVEAVRQSGNGEGILEQASAISKQLEEDFGESAGLHIARERHDKGRVIADSVETKVTRKEPFSERLREYIIGEYTGIPIMLGVVLGVLLFTSTVGRILGGFTEGLWSTFASPAIRGLLKALVGNQVLENILAWGLDI